jgi:peroxiredoxin
MMKNLSRSLFAVLAIALLVAPVLASELKPGDTAPAFTLKDQTGKDVSLADFHGKTVVLEWTNPECPFVARHYKAHTMVNLAAKWAEKDVVWLAINSSAHLGVDHNMAFVKAEGLKYPVLADQSGDVGRAYGAKTTPHMFIIGGDGKLLYNGAIDDDKKGDKPEKLNYVDAALTSISAGKPIAQTATTPYGCSVKYGEAKAAKAASASR